MGIENDTHLFFNSKFRINNYHQSSFRGSNATVGIFLFSIKNNNEDCHGLYQASQWHEIKLRGLFNKASQLQHSIFLEQINPHRIVDTYEIVFPLPWPAFNLLFSCNSLFHTSKLFKMQKLHQIIFCRKTAKRVITMLMHSLHNIRCHACIQCRVQLIRNNIYARFFHTTFAKLPQSYRTSSPTRSVCAPQESARQSVEVCRPCRVLK